MDKKNPKESENVQILKNILDMRKKLKKTSSIGDEILELVIKGGYDDEGVPKAWFTKELHQKELSRLIQKHQVLRAEMLEVHNEDKFAEGVEQYRFWDSKISWLELEISKHSQDVKRLFGVSLNTDDLGDYHIYNPVLSNVDCQQLEPIQYNESQRLEGVPVADTSLNAVGIKLNAWNQYDRTRELVKKHKPMTQAETDDIMEIFLRNHTTRFQHTQMKRIHATDTHKATFKKQRERWFDKRIKSKDEQREIFRLMFKKMTLSNQFPQFKDMLNLLGLNSPVNDELYHYVARKFAKYWVHKSKSEQNMGYQTIDRNVCMVPYYDTDYDDLTHQPKSVPEINDTYMRSAGERDLQEVLQQQRDDEEFLKDNPKMANLMKEVMDIRKEKFKEFISGGFGNNKDEVDNDKKIKAIKI